MLRKLVHRGAVLGGTLALLLTAAPAQAFTTYTPNRFDDPTVGGTTCTPPAPPNGCSLRGAIAAATDGDTIQLKAGIYVLTQGELKIVHSLTINGPAANKTTIKQTAKDRVIEADSSLQLGGLTITGGNLVGTPGADGSTPGAAGGSGQMVSGGGILGSSAPVTLTFVVITGNRVTGGSGGRGGAGSGLPGGVGGDGGAAAGAGVSIPNGTLSLDHVAITNNVAQAGSGGTGGAGGSGSPGGKGGFAGEATGAGISSGAGVINAFETLIAGNRMVGGTGGTGGSGGTLTGSPGSGGSGEPSAGAGLFSQGRAVNLTNVTFTGNVSGGSAGGKGGDAKSSSVQTDGGAGGSGDGGWAGAMFLFDDASGRMASVTMAGNASSGAAGGLGGAGSDGGATGAKGTTLGTQGGNLMVSVISTLMISDSIIAAGHADAGTENCTVSGGSFLTSLGHNLEDRNQCFPAKAAGDLVNTPAGLGPLRDNGGATQTMALLAGSKAIQHGASPCVDAIGGALHIDQRDLPRRSPCDIGAFEGQPAKLVTAPVLLGKPIPAEAVDCVITTVRGDRPFKFSYVWLRNGKPIPGAHKGSYRVTAKDVKHKLSCRATMSNPYGSSSANTKSALARAATLAKLKLSPSKARNGKLVSISFTLSDATSVTFSLVRLSTHRTVRGGPRPISALAGRTRRAWTPKGLKPGRYRFTATPLGGRPVSVIFTVKKK